MDDTAVATAPETESPDLEDLGAILRRRRAELGVALTTGSSATTRYPTTADAQLICTKCERDFVLPLVYHTHDRVLGGVPELCGSCRSEMFQAQEVATRVDTTAPKRDTLQLMEQAGGNPYEYGRFQLETFEAFRGRERALKRTRDLVEAVLQSKDPYDKIHGLYIVGDTGTAKTALAHCALRRLLEAGFRPGRDVIFDDALSLIEQIQDTYGSGASTWKILEARFRTRFWILDDLGAEKPSDDVVRKLTVIFNRREGRPTLVTSNVSPDQLEARHREFFRLASRFGPAQFRMVQAQGENARFTSEAP